jgi:hypothetical protein
MTEVIILMPTMLTIIEQELITVVAMDTAGAGITTTAMATEAGVLTILADSRAAP